jgi:hypothetical protein
MPRDGELTCAHYSDEELAEVLRSIDRHAYPLNFATLRREIEARGGRMADDEAATLPSVAASAPQSHAQQVKASVGALLACLWFVGVGVLGIAEGDLHFAWRGRTLFAGDAAWAFFGFVVACTIANVVRLAGLEWFDGERGRAWVRAGNGLMGVGALVAVLAWLVLRR